MHVLFLTENFPPETNAAATRVYERACYWVEWGHKVTVVTCAPNFPTGKVFPSYKNRLYQTEIMNGIRVVRMKTFISPNKHVVRRILDFLSFMVSGFFGGLIQQRPDVVVSTSPQFFTAVAAWGVSFFRRIPYVFELGDLWPGNVVDVGVMERNLPIVLLEKVELFLYRQSCAVVALTRGFKENLVSRGIPGDKIAVIINGVDLPRYAPIPRDKTLETEWGLKDCFVVGYIGTHGMSQGLSNVLDAAALLLDEPNVRYIFVGAGATRDDLISEAARRNLSNVIFIPPQPKEDMPRIWSLCDVALVHLRNLPVFETVIPSKIFEAMGMGLPLALVSPPGESKRILDETKAGVWIPAEDPGALAEATRDLYGDRDKLLELGRNSLASAPMYTRERQAREMISVLEASRGRNVCVPESVR